MHQPTIPGIPVHLFEIPKKQAKRDAIAFWQSIVESSGGRTGGKTSLCFGAMFLVSPQFS